MPNLLLPLIRSVIHSVRTSATEAGGNVTWTFSQMTPPVDPLIKGHKTSSGGICEMLSAKWIERHAHDDHLANWLAPGGGGGGIDASKIRLLMQLFIIGNDMGPGDMIGRYGGPNPDQTMATRMFLESRGLSLRSGSNPAVRSAAASTMTSGSRGGGKRRVLASQLARELVKERNSAGSYRTIGVWGPHAAHAMAAWVAEDVAFFDPNFGEFWFENHTSFVNWFPTFWHKSHYSSPVVGLSDRWEVMDYAKKI